MRIKCFEPIIDFDSKVLILGTIPGQDSLKGEEYYKNEDNIFWDIIFRIFDKDFGMFDLIDEDFNYTRKINLLRNNKIALWDVYESCKREGNRDSKIVDPIFNDIKKILLEYPNIKKIVCNGKAAYSQLNKIKRELPDNIEYVELYSTSSTSPVNSFYILKQWRDALI